VSFLIRSFMRYGKLVACVCAGFIVTSPVSGTPDYPYEAKRARLSGTAIYEVHLRRDRTVSRIVVARSCGFRILDEYGAAVLREWRFEKAPPSLSIVRVPMTFGKSR
jgi:TonB family protein